MLGKLGRMAVKATYGFPNVAHHAIIGAIAGMLAIPPAALADATLLPNARQVFLDNNGKPVALGSVYFYVPSTTTGKTVWSDSAKSTALTNPVALDAAGRPVVGSSEVSIFGDGTYRQILKTSTNVTLWDATTASTGTGGGSTPTATGDGDLVGTIKPWAGLLAPSQYVFAYGQALSRSTYSALFTAITFSSNVICATGSTLLSGISSTEQIRVGAAIEASCLAPGTTVATISSTNAVTLSAAATASASTTGVFFPWGNGDGSTTFNMPDMRGYVPGGRDNMGGTAANRLSAAYFAVAANALGAAGGSQSYISTIAQLPVISFLPTGTIGGVSSTNGFIKVGSGGTNPGALASGSAVSTQSDSISGGSFSFTGDVITFGGATGHSAVQPTVIVNYIIKVTPDTNAATASGVTSLGGMTGDIACGGGLLCTGNVISNSGIAIANNATAIGTGTAITNGPLVFYPNKYGAATNASAATNTTQIQNAVNDAVLAGGGDVVLGCGTYQISGASGITLAVTQASVHIRGCGWLGGTYLQQTTAGGNCITATGTDSTHLLPNFLMSHIGCTTSGALGGSGIALTYTAYAKLTDVSVADYAKGYALHRAAQSYISTANYTLTLNSGATAIVGFDYNGADGGSVSTICNNCSSGYSSGNTSTNLTNFSAYGTNVADLIFYSPQTQGGKYGMLFDYTTAVVSASGATDVVVQNPTVDGWTTAGIYVNGLPAKGSIKFTDGWSNPAITGAETDNMLFNNSIGVVVSGHQFYNFNTGGSAYGIKYTGTNDIHAVSGSTFINLNFPISGNTVSDSNYVGNTIYNDPATPATTMIDLQNASLRNSFTGNNLVGTATTGLKVSASASCYATGNTIASSVTTPVVDASNRCQYGVNSGFTGFGFSWPSAATSGGVPYFSGTNAVSSSALLGTNQIILGGGSGSAPAGLGGNGTATTLLHGAAGTGAPTFAAVALATDVTGQLPLANGGTGANLTADLGAIPYSTASALGLLAHTATANLPLLSGSSAAPTWAAVSYPTVGVSGGVAYFSSTSTMASSVLLGVNQLMLGGGAAAGPSALGSNGSATTVLHGAAGTGAPTFGAVVSADLNLTTTTCSNQFLTATAANGTGTCTTDVLASAQHANQGTTVTVLHGNAAGNPAFGAVSLTADVSGTLPLANGGTGQTTGAWIKGKITTVTSSQTIARTTGVLAVRFECIGQGGGGAGAAASATGITSGGGGGSGGYSEVFLNIPAASYVIVIGAGSNGGATGDNNGTAGTDSTVVVNGVTVCVGKGGSGGAQNGTAISGVGGAGGVAGTGDFTSVGNAGTSGNGGTITTITGVQGQGGPSLFGGSVLAGVAAATAVSSGAAGTANSGAGGNGGIVNGSVSTAAGGAGGTGVVKITEYLNQ